MDTNQAILNKVKKKKKKTHLDELKLFDNNDIVIIFDNKYYLCLIVC